MVHKQHSVDHFAKGNGTLPTPVNLWHFLHEQRSLALHVEYAECTMVQCAPFATVMDRLLFSSPFRFCDEYGITTRNLTHTHFPHLAKNTDHANDAWLENGVPLCQSPICSYWERYSNATGIFVLSHATVDANKNAP
jgi:hypothetical protein